MPALGGRLQKRFDHVKNMIRHFAVRAVNTISMHGANHVGQTKSATVRQGTMGQRDLLPGVFPGSTQIHRPAKGIRIGCAERPFCSINLDIWQAVVPDIKASDDRANDAVREFYQAGDMRWCIHWNCTTCSARTGHDAFREGCLGDGADAADRSKHRDQRSEVIWSHIKEWPRAGLVEKRGIRMPVLHAVIQQEGCSRYRCANRSIIDQPNACLQALTQKGVGRAAYAQVLRGCSSQDSMT